MPGTGKATPQLAVWRFLNIEDDTAAADARQLMNAVTLNLSRVSHRRSAARHFGELGAPTLNSCCLPGVGGGSGPRWTEDSATRSCHDAIWRWWQRLGRNHYWFAPRMLVLCDCGGSNGNRQRRFKEELCYLGADLQMDLQVAHYPPGCSKYNPIEHRMLCHVSRALQAVVLKTIEVARQFISRTTTGLGLRVVAEVAHVLSTGHSALPARSCPAVAVPAFEALAAIRVDCRLFGHGERRL